MQLYEQCRPKCWDEVVGQDKVLARVNSLRTRGLAGRSYWLTGQSGTGKTTIARLIAAEIASEWGTEEIDATDLSAARIRELARQSQTYGLGERTGRAIIINEAHGLTRGTVRQLLTILEAVPAHAVWIFTTTTEGQLRIEGLEDAGPLLSRCHVLHLSRRGLAEAFAKRARQIAVEAGLDSRPPEAYLRLAKDCRNNLREMLTRIEAGEMT